MDAECSFYENIVNFFARMDAACAQPALNSYRLSISQFESILGDRLTDAALSFASHQQEIWDVANIGTDLFEGWWETRSFTYWEAT
jgi:hypothetical protein